ncbi:YibE/F family protein [Photobacterium sp. ZSDE20]|uniref:YibE/F family protein n=1 Tax=Photobacterium pectinilyticum TaxID=2906793 RepID=A0ABT1N1N3_9GAMM|nr:YibE/F family protein [Photobacterium sp. ZSDE20]MCQ1058648.1 YibE/F family protein [Photobacterium sp. ZSDE20]MDD1823362.1 YibE/F family protein [Photobacterium sp. ZSDE20]
MLKRLIFPFVVFLISTAILWYSPSVSESFRPKAYNSQEFVRASVIDVLAESTQSDPLVPSVKTGRQRLLVELREGEDKGKQVEVENQLSRLHNVYVTEGDNFILLIREQGERTIYWPYNHDRSSAVYWMVGIIVLLTVLFAGLQGVNSVVSLYFTGALLIGVLVPALFAGWNPILLTIGLMAVKIVVNFLLVAGWNKKSLVSMLGTLAGVVMAGLMAQFFGEMAQLNGLYLEKGEDILYLGGEAQVQVRWLLFVAIMISALGAVMDVAISMASSYHELREMSPQQPEKDRLLATIRIGRDILGTMTNTLVLAFAGSALTTIMMVWGFQMPLMQFMNIPALSLAMIHGLAGSIGLIMTVPLTVLIASAVYQRD